MQCPECESTHIRKNGKKQGKQNHICVDCGRQFIDVYSPAKGYSDEMKTLCLRMVVNGTGFRAIERVTSVTFGPVGIAIAVGATVTISVFMQTSTGKELIGQITDVMGRGLDGTIEELRRILDRGGKRVFEKF
jgi:hypothetical protein